MCSAMDIHCHWHDWLADIVDRDVAWRACRKILGYLDHSPRISKMEQILIQIEQDNYSLLIVA